MLHSACVLVSGWPAQVDKISRELVESGFSYSGKDFLHSGITGGRARAGSDGRTGTDARTGRAAGRVALAAAAPGCAAGFGCTLRAGRAHEPLGAF